VYQGRLAPGFFFFLLFFFFFLNLIARLPLVDGCWKKKQKMKQKKNTAETAVVHMGKMPMLHIDRTPSPRRMVQSYPCPSIPWNTGCGC
jgi:hypothetical protein